VDPHGSLIPQPRLRTDRLVLRALEPRDDGAFWRLRSDPVVGQWLERNPWPGVDRAREERLKLQVGIDAGKWCFWALSEADNGPLVGTICLWDFSADRTEAEVGFELFPSRMGRGLMAEAAEAVFTWAWEGLGLEAVTALVHHQNRPARGLLEKGGFVEGPVPSDWVLTPSEVLTQVYYRRQAPR